MQEEDDHGEFDYGGRYIPTHEETISLENTTRDIQRREENKQVLATTGTTPIALFTDIVDEGKVYNPVDGKVRKLFRYRDTGPHKKHEYWPGPYTDSKNKGYVCWWDTYKFQGVPWGYVIEYDERRQSYTMAPGVFCSPNCVSAFAHSTYGKHMFSGVQWSWTRQYFRQIMKIPYTKRITRAPPKEWLKRFNPDGGITIEEYRKDFEHCMITVLPQNMLCNVTLVEEIRFQAETRQIRKRRLEMLKRQTGSKKRRAEQIKANPIKPKTAKQLFTPSNQTTLFHLLTRGKK